MSETTLSVRRKATTLEQDSARVITKFHFPGDVRAQHIIDRILKLTRSQAEELLEQVLDDFSDRHKDLPAVFTRHYERVRHLISNSAVLSQARRQLIGAFFTNEYSVEAAAFFNPSIVPHPDQSGLRPGEARIILSFRATGEGHISSIEFRSGVLDKRNNIIFDPVSPYVETPEVIPNPEYDRHTFLLKLEDLDSRNDIAEGIISMLGEQFTLQELRRTVDNCLTEWTIAPAMLDQTVTNILWLAYSNYEVSFHSDHQLSERVLFPVSENERNGIEDARFVRFLDNGKTVYYATYTAFNGFRILPQLIETEDFLHFRVITLNGKAAQNKGMALFPRKIDGQYMMISRQDGENLYIMSSENLHFWHEANMLRAPRSSWEFFQIGNCGSPIETEAGWLLLTHGVGPMREYCIGVDMLDKKDPGRVIAHLDEPLLAPMAMEREGYVPNVVYSCGAMIHNNELVLPYAMSDTKSGIAVVSLQDLLDRLLV